MEILWNGYGDDEGKHKSNRPFALCIYQTERCTHYTISNECVACVP